MKHSILSTTWTNQFVDAWNVSKIRNSLAALGVVRFVCTSEKPDQIVQLFWDETGTVSLSPEEYPSELVFRTDRLTWISFFEGKESAVKAVIDGDIIFEGNFEKILPFVDSINNISIVVKEMNSCHG